MTEREKTIGDRIWTDGSMPGDEEVAVEVTITLGDYKTANGYSIGLAFPITYSTIKYCQRDPNFIVSHTKIRENIEFLFTKFLSYEFERTFNRPGLEKLHTSIENDYKKYENEKNLKSGKPQSEKSLPDYETLVKEKVVQFNDEQIKKRVKKAMKKAKSTKGDK
jgi:hypothetical protein